MSQRADHGLSTWAPAAQMIAAVQPRLRLEADRLRAVLDASSARLAPLTDPLLTDFGLHRWLKADREEAYSDWLAWLFERLQTPDLVLRVLGLDTQEMLTSCLEASLKVKRELRVPQGHPGKRGRLDLVVRYANRILACVEIKTGPADVADTAKQPGYRSWLDEQEHVLPTNRRAILLVTEAADDESEGGFQVLLWSEVCVRFRNLLPKIMARHGIMVATMTLAFVGAVEQNLLRLSAAAARVREGGVTLVDPAVTEHLLRSLDVNPEVAMTPGDSGAGDITQATRQFLAEGLESYVGASIAVKEFRREIQRRARPVVEHRLPDLLEAIGLTIKPPQVTDYRNPDKLSLEWLAVTCQIPGLGDGYFGMLYRTLPDSAHSIPGVVAMLAPGQSISKELLLRAGRTRNQNMENDYGREISIWRRISSDEMDRFAELLDETIERWVTLWRDVGGLVGLSSDG